MNFSALASSETVNKTIESLKANGISAHLVATSEEAKTKVLSLIPNGAEVMTMTSITLDQTGLTDALNDSSRFDSVKAKLSKMNRETESQDMQRIGAAPDWVVGSVHAITEDGQIVVASNTGSQLPAYAYGSNHVIWVVSTKKIVSSLEQGIQRINDHIVPQETLRARQAYGLPENWDTFPSKILTISREVNPNRAHVIFVNEDLGF